MYSLVCYTCTHLVYEQLDWQWMWSLQSFLQAFSNRFIPLIAGMEDSLFKEDSEGSTQDKKIGMKLIRFNDDVYNWQKYFWFIKGTSLFINLQTSGKLQSWCTLLTCMKTVIFLSLLVIKSGGGVHVGCVRVYRKETPWWRTFLSEVYLLNV